jgi:hypothetical protein
VIAEIEVCKRSIATKRDELGGSESANDLLKAEEHLQRAIDALRGVMHTALDAPPRG